MTAPDTAPGDAFEQMVNKYTRCYFEHRDLFTTETHDAALAARSALIAEYRRVEQERDRLKEALGVEQQSGLARLSEALAPLRDHIASINSERDAALQQVQALQKEAWELRERRTELDDFICRAACWVSPTDVYNAVRQKRDELYADNVARHEAALATGSAGETQHE